jgi:hypothetical protein
MDVSPAVSIAEPAAPRKIVKRRKAKPGERAAKDIKALQKSTKLILPRATIHRLVAELLASIEPDFRVSKSAVDALREVSDAMLTKNFKVANKLARDVGRRNTVTTVDFVTASQIVGDCAQFVEKAV